MVNGFSRDYWPAGTKHAYARAALALAVSPILAAATTILAMLVLETVLSRNFDITSLRSLQVAPVVLVGSFVLALSIGAVAFVILWLARLRSRMAYAFVGLLLSLAFSVIAPFLGFPKLGFVPVLVMAAHFTIYMLIFRAIAGIRRIDD